MRRYVSMSNLKAAVLLGSIATIMSIPRIGEGGMPLHLYVPAALLAMVLVGGAATAWSGSAGLAGLIPERQKLLRGMLIAVALVAAFAPIQLFLMDPVFRQVLEATGDKQALALRYPTTLFGGAAIVLWAAGFETLFFYAAPVSFLTRLTGRPWMAIVMTTGLRLIVVSEQLTLIGTNDATALFFASAAATTLISCLLFARFGLPATSLFAAGLNLHLLAGLICS